MTTKQEKGQSKPLVNVIRHLIKPRDHRTKRFTKSRPVSKTRKDSLY